MNRREMETLKGLINSWRVNPVSSEIAALSLEEFLVLSGFDGANPVDSSSLDLAATVMYFERHNKIS